MDKYKHGTYGELSAPTAVATTSPCCVVYVGTAPAHKIKGQSKRTDLFNTPLRITSLTEARRVLGYSELAPFEKYTLCEAVEAHFKNSIETVGPFYAINVLDPNKEGYFEEDEEGFELSVTKKQAKFVLGDRVLDSIQVETVDQVTSPTEESELPTIGEGEVDLLSEEIETDGVLIEGIDYLLTYDLTTDMVTLTFTGEEVPTKVLIKSTVVNPMAIGADEIIGEVTEEGKKSGLQAIKTMYPKFDEIVNIIAAPGFSEIPVVYEAMLEVATLLNGHWSSFVNADVPTEYDGKKINTRLKAIEWKKEHGYTGKGSEAHWPPAILKNGKRIHLSTVFTAKMEALDLEVNGVPFQTPSNKELDIAGLDGGEDFELFDYEEANLLNENGIATAVRLGGTWRGWGTHTAAYNYEDEQEANANPEAFDRTAQFTAGMRTFQYILNRFQADNLDLIDQPMTIAIKDTIIQREQSKLDGLVAMGALIGQPTISFSEDNTADDIMGGSFTWDMSATTNVPLKSATVRLQYTDDGIYMLLGEEE